MIKLEILGTGCMECKRLMKNVDIAIQDLGVQVEVIKVDDISAIIARGVVLTPALAVNGTVKVEGRVADVKEIKEILKGASG
jgi:small redox-active disulfide protein 2